MIPVWALILFVYLSRQGQPLLLISALGSSMFFVDMSVVRSDLLALPFLLIFCGWLLHPPKGRTPSSAPLIPLAAAVAAILITPKSLVPVVCLFPLLLHVLRNASGRERKKFAVFLGIGFSILVFCLDWPRIFGFFQNLWTLENYGFPYWSIKRFDFLLRTFQENPQIPVLLALGFALMAVKKTAPPARFISFTLLLSSLFLFPDKLPFWIGTCVFLLFFLMSDVFPTSKPARVVLSFCAIFSVLNGVHWIAQRTTTLTNSDQAEFIEAFENIHRTTPYMRIYDGIGLSIPDNLPPHYIGPGQTRENRLMSVSIAQAGYEMLLMSNKLAVFYPFMANDLAKSYSEISPGIFVRSHRMTLRNPGKPGSEILAALQRHFAPHLTDLTEAAVFIHDPSSDNWSLFQNRSFRLTSIPTLPALCRDCGDIEVSVTPFGRYMGLSAFGEPSRIFRFESEKPRRSLLPVFYSIN
ncbi:MAG: hypothetical protein KF802_11670 [Bdellovibrionaceae bacterium]|nr:hypothetical protein [Pseudobdellovibrionaceae bacterium]